MAKSNADNATLTSYAQALLELAESRDLLTQTAEDVAGINHVIAENPTFAHYVGDPSVSQSERDQLIDRVFGDRTSTLLVSYLKLLNSKHRLNDFPGIAAAFKTLLDKRSGNVDVEVIVAHPLEPQMLDEVRQQLGAKMGKNVNVSQHIDESLIGGVILKIGDSLIDGSVKNQLETLKKRLVAAV